MTNLEKALLYLILTSRGSSGELDEEDLEDLYHESGDSYELQELYEEHSDTGIPYDEWVEGLEDGGY